MPVVDLKCTDQLLTGQIVLQPSEFVIKENGSQRVEIVVGMTDKEFMTRVDRYDVGAVLGFTYTDLVDSAKPYK